MVEAVGEGDVAFQGVFDPATVKMKGYKHLIRIPDKAPELQNFQITLVD